MNNGEHLSKEGIVKILSYAGPMNKGLSEKFHKEYPGISLAQLPVVESPQESLDPNWLVGFTDGVRRPVVFSLTQLTGRITLYLFI